MDEARGACWVGRLFARVMGGALSPLLPPVRRVPGCHCREQSAEWCSKDGGLQTQVLEEQASDTALLLRTMTSSAEHIRNMHVKTPSFFGCPFEAAEPDSHIKK